MADWNNIIKQALTFSSSVADWTAPIDCWAALEAVAAASGDYCNIGFYYVNGTTQILIENIYTRSGVSNQQNSGYIRLLAGQKVRVTCTGNAGASVYYAPLRWVDGVNTGGAGSYSAVISY
jgi:hypothetical protein